jgi:hypothetical protein
MAARETEIRSLEWIGTIRAAQEQLALQTANQAALAAGAATAAQIEVEKRCELALAEWDIAVSQGAQFDPRVAAIWAHELSVSDAQLLRPTGSRLWSGQTVWLMIWPPRGAKLPLVAWSGISQCWPIWRLSSTQNDDNIDRPIAI